MTVARVSETNFAAPRAELVGPFRNRELRMIGAARPVLMTAKRALMPRIPE